MRIFFIHGTPALKNRRVEMLHANTDEASKTRILEDLSKQSESIQVLQLLLEWASIWQMLTLWYTGDYQILAWVTEVGRCARDGRPGYAICYAFKWSVMKCSDESLKRLVKLESGSRCIVLKKCYTWGHGIPRYGHIIARHTMFFGVISECHWQQKSSYWRSKSSLTVIDTWRP